MDTSFSNTYSVITLIVLVGGLLIDLVIRIVMLFYVPRNRKPTSAMAWLLAIYVLPFVGTLVFFIIGNNKLSKNRRQKQRFMSKRIEVFAENLKRKKLTAPVRGSFHNSAVLAQAFGGFPPVRGNKVEIIDGYDEIIQDMTNALDTAERYIYIEFFIIALDSATESFFVALERAIARGVRVYVLFDSLGSYKYKRYKEMQERLTAMGAYWHKMLPPKLRIRQYDRPDLRNHRKIVVIDNMTAFIGSLNMIQRSYGRRDGLRYLELATRMHGPIVNECAAVFASDWYAETGKLLNLYAHDEAKPVKRGHAVAQILPSGPGYAYENNLKLFVSLIFSAKRSIVITNPYFVPDESLLSAIISAAKRGVKISMLNSEIMDQRLVGHAQRSYYEQILKAGVEIYLYKSPILQHSKYMTVDQSVSVVGSSNMDVRSFELDLECVSIIYDKRVSKKLHRLHITQCLEESKSLSRTRWKKRSFVHGLMDSIARLTSALQ